eukprot:gene6042-7526_t
MNYGEEFLINNFCSQSKAASNITETSIGNSTTSTLTNSNTTTTTINSVSDQNDIYEIIKTIEDHPSEGPLAEYRKLLNDSKIRHDSHQMITVKILQNLYNQLKHNNLLSKIDNVNNIDITANGLLQETKQSTFSKWVSMLTPMVLSKTNLTEKTFIKGIYLHGDVGCGKSFLMDLFFNSIDIKKKKRVHFHHFMLDVHRRIHLWRQTKRPDENDPIPPLSKQLVNESWLLCFDEFQVTDVSDAMILKRLFSSMFEHGAVLVATSNRQPQDLYKNGLNRQLFIPFIHFLESKCIVHNLNSGLDYRLTGERTKRVFFQPLTPENQNSFNHLFKELTHNEPPTQVTLTLNNGRQVIVPRSVRGVAFYKFPELCETVMGAADYIEISRNHHTIFIEGIPQMNESTKNQARRFITLIDIMYEHKVKLICTAASGPSQLFMSSTQATDTNHSSAEIRQLMDDLTLSPDQLSRFNGEEERFMFSRAVSRLVEMQSDIYLSTSQ